MAFRSLSDRSSTINSHPNYSTFTAVDWLEHIEDYLAKSQALLHIGMQHALDDSSSADRFYFCSIVEESLQQAQLGLEQLQTKLKS